MPPFLEKESFQKANYKLLPFVFSKHSKSEYILSNDSGEYLLIDKCKLEPILTGDINKTDPDLYNSLKAKFFIADEINDRLLSFLATKVRTKKSFLFDFTSLHIFVVTLRCDHSCVYCQVSRQNVQANSKYDMSAEVADRAVETAFKSPSKYLKFEMQGGEPTLNFNLIKRIVLRAEEINKIEKRNIQFILATNLSNITDEQIEFCKIYNLLISTSLDGPELLHNGNRPIPTNDSHQRFIKNLARVRERLGQDQVSALMTTTTYSLEKPKEIIDEYLRLGFRNIFLRSISPYGFALKSKRYSSYEPGKFLQFYKNAFEYILEINRNGRIFVETFAEIILRKLLTPFPSHFVDLQSPAGVGIGAIVYNYDGLVYPSDEARMLAEMNDQHFVIGDLHQDSYEGIFSNPILYETVQDSIAEALPGCSDCAYRPYCGGDPTYHYAVQGDEIGFRPLSGFCKKNMEVIRYLINKVREKDPQITEIFNKWIHSRG